MCKRNYHLLVGLGLRSFPALVQSFRELLLPPFPFLYLLSCFVFNLSRLLLELPSLTIIRPRIFPFSVMLWSGSHRQSCSDPRRKKGKNNCKREEEGCCRERCHARAKTSAGAGAEKGPLRVAPPPLSSSSPARTHPNLPPPSNYY